MHEQSLVKSLLKQVEAVCAREDGAAVSGVRIEIGPLSGVEPLLVAAAFQRLATGGCTAGAELTIDEVPLVAACTNCRAEISLEQLDFRCPGCGGNMQVVRGDGMQLVSVTLREHLPPCDDGEPDR